MEAKQLYGILGNDFEIAKCRDDWSKIKFNKFYTKSFRKRYMGVVLDNAKNVNKVYTAVFPSEDVLLTILDKGETDIMIFTHHPMVWDITKTPVFSDIDAYLLPRLRERKISLYTLHVPLDKVGNYSTATTLARVFGMTPESEFYRYYGVYVGVIAKSDLDTVDAIAKRAKLIVGHDAKIYKYGKKQIENKKVAFVGGGGNDPDVIKELAKLGINTFVTGVTKLNLDYAPSIDAHNLAQKLKINLVGLTHYSSEEFACKAMVAYFEKLGIPGEFIEGKPCLDDM
jgi:putative NIF3 family GTP cyclohydrolase 1 type 2